MTKLFSLIIPAYNAEKYISNCIQSILSQKFSKKKYEIIIINDASKDKTQRICNKFKKKNKFIKVLNNKKNLGVSSSRNLGVKSALGKYVIFTDSDDTLKKNSLKNLNKILSKDEVDLLIALNLSNKEKKIYSNKFHKKRNIFNDKDLNTFFKFLNSGIDFKPYAWNYILSRKYFIKNNIYFKKQIKLFEDNEFTARVLCSVKKITLYKDTFHEHNERFASLTRSIGFEPTISCLKTMNELCKILKSNKLIFEKKKFLHERINLMLKKLKIYLLTCDKQQIKKICHFIKRNISNFKVVKVKFLENIILNQKKINRVYKLMPTLVEKSKYLIKKVDKNKFFPVYIFGLGLYGRVALQILRRQNINITALLDNNKNFYNKKYLGLKILNQTQLKKLGSQKLKKLIVIISINNQVIANKIYNQLKIYGLNSRNIKKINWTKIMSQVYA